MSMINKDCNLRSLGNSGNISRDTLAIINKVKQLRMCERCND